MDILLSGVGILVQMYSYSSAKSVARKRHLESKHVQFQKPQPATLGDQWVHDGARDERSALYAAYDRELESAWQAAPTGFGSREFVGQREGDLCTT